VKPMILYYLRVRREHPPAGNTTAAEARLHVDPFRRAGVVLTGMSLYWPVQFGPLASLFGGYDTARIWHFIFTAGFTFFFMVTYSW